ncbi:hypothetical protein [Actinosynnema sp. NPDC020468]|uniref:hypothetical protein n=1 Tax=Actinosynnema sp. NPDC020468 TaxID=3154488 RepID=UPI003408F628
MTNETYDPLVRQWRGIGLRFGSARGAAPGTALVLEHPGGRLDVVPPGRQVPRRWWGGHRAAYLVDTTRHRLSVSFETPSADGWEFVVTVRFSCQVVDPVVVPHLPYRDVAGSLQGAITDRVRPVLRRMDALATAEAEAEVTRLVQHGQSPPGFALSAFAAEVDHPRGDLAEARRQSVVDRFKRTEARSVVTGDRADLAAHLLTRPDADPVAVLKAVNEALGQDFKNELEYIEMAKGTLSQAVLAQLLAQRMNLGTQASPRTPIRPVLRRRSKEKKTDPPALEAGDRNRDENP